MKPYTPREGTMAAKLIAHLSAAGEGAKLTGKEISVKFDVPSGNVRNTLAPAIAHGVLKLQALPTRGFLIMLGDGTPPPEQPRPAAPDRPADW